MLEINMIWDKSVWSPIFFQTTNGTWQNQKSPIKNVAGSEIF